MRTCPSRWSSTVSWSRFRFTFWLSQAVIRRARFLAQIKLGLPSLSRRTVIRTGFSNRLHLPQKTLSGNRLGLEWLLDPPCSGALASTRSWTLLNSSGFTIAWWAFS